MVTLFDERDLVSFGMYMISDQRKESIKNNPEITNNELRKMLLKTVTQFDFNNWLALKLKSEQEEQENLTTDNDPTAPDSERTKADFVMSLEDSIQDEAYPEDLWEESPDVDSKVIKMGVTN